MKLTRLGDDCWNKRDCPTIYRTDRRTFIVTGLTVDDAEVLATLNLSTDETAVEVPEALARKVWGYAV